MQPDKTAQRSGETFFVQNHLFQHYVGITIKKVYKHQEIQTPKAPPERQEFRLTIFSMVPIKDQNKIQKAQKSSDHESFSLLEFFFSVDQGSFQFFNETLLASLHSHPIPRLKINQASLLCT